MVSAPCSSPSYSNSIFPVMAGSEPYTSLTRGTTCFSLSKIERCSALESTFSNTLIGSRWLTPERPSMRLSPRASNATRSTSSRMKSGSSSARPSRSSHASCSVISIPCSTVGG
jgi:hypothetical protein